MHAAAVGFILETSRSSLSSMLCSSRTRPSGESMRAMFAESGGSRRFACGRLWVGVWSACSGFPTAGEHFLHSLKFIAFEFSAAGLRLCQETVHQGQQVAAKAALVGMALEDLLRVFGVDGDFFAAAVIPRTAAWAVHADFRAGAFHVERDPTFGSRCFQRGVGLQSVNVDVATRFVHRAIGKSCEE